MNKNANKKANQPTTSGLLAPDTTSPTTMPRQLVIQSGDDEIKAAVLEHGELAEIYIERDIKQRMVGSIYKGRVENVLPGMQAAFVDIGMDKNAFLYIKDIFAGGGYEKLSRDINIKDILKTNQEIVVQISKEPIGNKGPRVTCQLSLPGRYYVMMSGLDGIAVSRQITDDKEKERLRSISAELKPEDKGLIVRTAAFNAEEEELKEDLAELTATWQKIEKDKLHKSAPALLHRDLCLVERLLRDYATPECGRITVNTNESYELVIKTLEDDPLKNKVALKDGENLFADMGISREIHRTLRRRVWLKSGGYIVIDQVEALCIIDVNTGKYVGNINLEDTVYTINIEAANEIARQLRLRNIGGIIVIDFIDQKDPENKKKILKELEEALKNDRVRTYILGITTLGLVELTRKKMGHSLSGILEKTCPCCDGKGTVLAETSVAALIHEEVEMATRRNEGRQIVITANPAVASVLIGTSGKNQQALESKTNKKISIRSNPLLPLEQYEITTDDHAESSTSLLPVEEHQILKVKIESVHNQKPDDGVARVSGFVLNIKDGGKYVGQELWVEITRIFRTYAWAEILNKLE